jgi:thioredoxin reductase
VSAWAFVFATGASDLIPLFENNDLPGVFGARGLRLFLERDKLVPGRNAVVYGTGRDALETVGLLHDWNVRVEAVVTVEGGDPPGEKRVPADARSARSAALVRAEGRDWVSRAVFETRSGDRLNFPCDLLCVAVPGQPSFELASQAGFRYAFLDGGEPTALEHSSVCDHLKTMLPLEDVLDVGEGPGRFLVGEASGRYEWRNKIEHAAGAGAAAARHAERP